MSLQEYWKGLKARIRVVSIEEKNVGENSCYAPLTRGEMKMNLKSLDNSKLITNLKSLRGVEKKTTVDILHYLREVESRRLHNERGYSSMFEFCTKELGYEESQAHRRISAARLLREFPELDQKIESGALTLTSLGQAQTFFRKEKSSKPEKSKILKVLENKSTREVERELVKLSPNPIPSENKRQITEDLTSATITLDRETVERLDQIKNLLSHKNPYMNYSQLVKEMSVIVLEELSPAEKKQGQKVPAAPKVNSVPSNRTGNSRYLPVEIERAVRARDKNRCTFEDPLTKRKCESDFQVQIDHVVPIAAGGKTELNNLRLLCRQHNLLSAVHWFGREKIESYIVK